jgi:hypothetical protein
MSEKISLTIPKDSGFTHVLFNLAAQGYEYIKVSYSGSGDSGCIDDIELIPNGFITIDEGKVQWNSMSKYRDFATPDEDLTEIIEQKSYAHVLNDAEDWYNNDGGGGTLYISTLDASFHCDHYINIVTTEDSVITGKFGDA